MKITRNRLAQIIKEELANLDEADDAAEIMQAIEDVPDAAAKIADTIKKEIEVLSAQSSLDPLVLAQAVAALLTTD